MKHIYLSLLTITTAFAQQPIVKKYKSMVFSSYDIVAPLQQTNVTVMIRNKDIVIFGGMEKETVLRIKDGVIEPKPQDVSGSQYVECEDENGTPYKLQMFNDDSCIRLNIAHNYNIEFYKD